MFLNQDNPYQALSQNVIFTEKHIFTAVVYAQKLKRKQVEKGTIYVKSGRVYQKETRYYHEKERQEVGKEVRKRNKKEVWDLS